MTRKMIVVFVALAALTFLIVDYKYPYSPGKIDETFAPQSVADTVQAAAEKTPSYPDKESSFELIRMQMHGTDWPAPSLYWIRIKKTRECYLVTESGGLYQTMCPELFDDTADAH